MENSVNYVAIGGLGGSGTRVFAQILQDLGYYIGDDLNHPLDNLDFTRLMKHSHLLNKATKEEEVVQRLILFKKLLVGQRMGLKELYTYYRFIINSPYTPNSKRWLLGKIWQAYKGNQKTVSTKIGWKEPNTQLFFPLLSTIFPEIKRSLVIRNGLDMAFSGNLQQLHLWGAHFGLKVSPNNSVPLPVLQLNYWITVNNRLLDAKERNEVDFYIIDFSSFQSHTARELNAWLHFLNESISEKQFQQLLSLIKEPPSHNRHKSQDLSIFSKAQLDEYSLTCKRIQKHKSIQAQNFSGSLPN